MNINNELNEIQLLLIIHKPFLNGNKMKYMIFHNHQRNIASLIPDVRVNNEASVLASEFSFLV